MGNSNVGISNGAPIVRSLPASCPGPQETRSSRLGPAHGGAPFGVLFSSAEGQEFGDSSTTGRSLSALVAWVPKGIHTKSDNAKRRQTFNSVRNATGRKIAKRRSDPVGFRCYYDRYNVRWLIRFTEDGRERLMLRSRFLMECHLGRPLLKREQVRHRDFDSRNDALSNLYVFELSDLGPLDPERRYRATAQVDVT